MSRQVAVLLLQQAQEGEQMKSCPVEWQRARTRGYAFALGVAMACSLAFLLPRMAVAQGTTDADTREISAYALTEPGLAKFRQASENLAELDEVVTAGCDDDSDDQSLDGMVARIRNTPDAAEAIESAGMPVREYAVFIFSMIQTGFAAWAMEQPGGTLPSGVSTANVEFYRAHETELQEAANLTEAVDCDSVGDDGYDEGDDDGYDGDSDDDHGYPGKAI